jgi:protein-L-isoaspartate(D-aspartate) O-methyltransferase
MTSARTRDRLIERLRTKGITDVKVIERLRNVPRHLFVDEALASRAYEDTALPIGCAQTISQPYVVARMCEALCAGGQPGKVLEVGTGSGYQTAVLAGLVRWVYSIGASRASARRAVSTNARQQRVQLHNDGLARLSAVRRPTTASSERRARMPAALLEQLADGGCLGVPVGPAGARAALLRRAGAEFTRTADLAGFRSAA